MDRNRAHLVMFGTIVVLVALFVVFMLMVYPSPPGPVVVGIIFLVIVIAYKWFVT